MSRSTMTHASQNVGNQLGDRSSTRIVRPPGGASSISFAWDAEPPAPARRTAAPMASNSVAETTTGMYGSGSAPYAPAPSYAPARTTTAPWGTDYGAPAPAPAPMSGRSLGGGPDHDSRLSGSIGGASGRLGGAGPYGGASSDDGDMYRTSAGAYGGGASHGSGSVPSPYSARSGSSSGGAYGSGAPSTSNDILTGGGPGLSSNAFANGANQNAGNFLTDRRTTRVLAAPGGKSSITFG